MKSENTLIDMQGVRKCYGKVTALDGIDLHLEKGEILGFLGPNGAGKTTTIRLLMGLMRADAGEITVLGKHAFRDAVTIHRKLAYVPGDVTLWPDLSGGEVIDLLLRLSGEKDLTRRDHLIRRFDLDPSKKCSTYSKGNRQKVVLIAALASSVDLLILDEPTSGLDPLMEQVFREEVLSAKARGIGVLLSSHLLEEVDRVSDTFAIIRKGKIVETGSREALRHVTLTAVRVRTKLPPDVIFTDPRFVDVKQENGDVVFEAAAEDLSSVMEILAAFGIESLDCRPPSLESRFLRHYDY